MANSHVFVIRGDITHLKCDAWMLPSDSRSSVTTAWTDAIPGLADAVSRTTSSGYRSGELFALALDGLPTEDPLPIMTAVPLRGFADADELAPRIREFVRVGAREAKRRREDHPSIVSRPIPLLAMPLFGTLGGGGHLLKGDVLDVILREAQKTATEEGVDVVLVLRDERTFALAQVKRKAPRYWQSLDGGLLRKAQGLAEIAKLGRLVPFMGAGTSVSAGAPIWADLIKLLAEKAGLSDAEKIGLFEGGMDALDQAAYLRARHETRMAEASSSEDGCALPTFNMEIASLVSLSRYGLAPALLASLRTEQAITMNYDTLFETASQDIGDERAVIPDRAVEGQKKWLLKLHGSVSNPESIVLTRDDYLGYNTSRDALSAVVKANLITHHLLFVGFGLRDDHFHEIIHDVGRAVPSDAQNTAGFATALTLFANPLHDTLWNKKLDLVSMSGTPKEENTTTVESAARTLEIFLDALLAHATDSHSYLLADEFEHALSLGERNLRESLIGLNADFSESEKGTASWEVVAATLRALGLAESDNRAG